MTDAPPPEPKISPQDELGKYVITTAETYIRRLAMDGDLSKQRVRRRLKLAVAELTRMRQVFAVNESAESGEIRNRARMGGLTMSDGAPMAYPGPYIGQMGSLNTPEGALDAQVEAPVEDTDTDIEGDAMRMQLPNPYETSTQRMIREVMSMATPFIDMFKKQQEAISLRAKVERANAILDGMHQAATAEKEGDHERAKQLRDLIAKINVDEDGPLPVMPLPAIPPLPEGIGDPVPHICPIQGTWSDAYMARLKAVEDGVSDTCPCCQKQMSRKEHPGIPAYVVCEVCPLQIGGAIPNPADDPSVNLQAAGAPETDVPF